MARCDLHVHSYFSGKTNHVKLLEPMDSYSTPDRIYATAKARGMDLVTITDHDSVGGCLDFLRRNPGARDFFISEEVSSTVPGCGYKLHVGVYDMRPEDHEAVSGLRSDADRLLDWLDSRGLFYAWNHPFYNLPTGGLGTELLKRFTGRFRHFEGVNSCLPPAINDAFSEGAARAFPDGRLIPVAGSDAHSLLRLGKTWTEAPGETVPEFFAALRRGAGAVHGNRGRFTGVFNDAMGVYLGYVRDLVVRNEVHRGWSFSKKVRNCAGWAAWLPVFAAGVFAYSYFQYRAFRKTAPRYRRLWEGVGAVEGGCAPGSGAP